MSFIEFNNVRKVYKTGEIETVALDRIDFSIEQGEFVIIALSLIHI